MKKALMFLLTVIAVILMLAITVSAEDVKYSGTWGELTWELDEATWTLTISGDATMSSLYGDNDAWKTYKGKIKSVIINDGVTSIGNRAFEDCSSLTSVTIGNGVTSIGYNAFNNCDSLENVYISDIAAWCNISYKETSFADSPLYYADKLYVNGELIKHVVIPEGVTTIPYFSFSCINVQSVEIPDSVTSIGNCAFYKCSSLTSITIPEGVTSIGDDAFCKCSSLTSITIPDSVTSIGLYAFEDCSSLTSITIPEGVTSIGSSVFRGCSSLTSITIPEGVTSIGSSAFRECSSLTSVIIGKDVNYLGNSAFGNCTSLENVYISDVIAWCNVTVDNNNTVSKDASPLYYADKLYVNGELIKHLIIPNGVTKIPENAFSCTNIESIVIPDSVTSIGNRAFEDCSSLTSVTIGNGVTSIGSYAFENCDSLENVYICDIAAWCGIVFESAYYTNPLYYADNLYLNGELVKHVVIPEGVTTIHSYAFSCTNIESIEIPSSVTKMEYYAFYDCYGLKDVYISDVAAWCGIVFESAYYARPIYYADNLYLNGELVKHVVIPSDTTSISPYAFYGYKNLESITIESGVTSVGSNAFAYCDSLKDIIVGDDVENIGYDAFYGCKNLKVVINKSNMDIEKCSSSNGYIAYYAVSVVDSEDKIINVNDFLFVEDEGIYYLYDYVGSEMNLVLPNKVNGQNYEILKNAFAKVKDVTSLTIGEGVKKIHGAFPEWNSLSYVEFNAINCADIPSYSRYFCGVAPIKVKIGPKVTRVPKYMFYNSNVVSVEFSENAILSEIGEFAFYGCYQLFEIINKSTFEITTGSTYNGYVGYYAMEIHSGESKIEQEGDYLFYDLNDKCYLIKYVGSDTNICLPSLYKGNKYHIWENAFCKNEMITSIVISEGITELDRYVFYYCTSLKTVELPLSITSIGYGAFYNCSSLESITIPPEVTSIGYGAFYNCTSLESITIPSEVTSIADNSFYNCGNLKTVYIYSDCIINNLTSLNACGGLIANAETIITNVDTVSTFVSTIFDTKEEFEFNGLSYTSYSQHVHDWVSCDVEMVQCVSNGFEGFVCSVCGIVKGDIILIHEWIDADCIMAKHCNLCEKEEGEPLGHDFADATCTEPKKCKRDGCNATEGSSLGHSFTNYVSNNDATCLTDGTKTAKCDVCIATDTVVDTGSALGHDFADATCLHPKTCKRDGCNATEGNSLGHSFTNYVSNNNATCIADGTKTAKCDRCDETDTITDDDTMLGHDFADATCTSPKTCKRDGCTVTEGNALGHSFTNYVSNNDATCLTDGTKTAKCDRCNETDTVTDTDSKLGHDFADATCTDPKTCKRDGCTVTEGVALGHSFTNYVCDNNATCTEDGTKTSKCDRCNETDTVTDTDSKLGHDFADATCTSPKTCKRDGCTVTEGNALGHNFTNYVSNNDATCLTDGTKTAKCDRCDETDTVADEGSALGHDFADATCTEAKKCKRDGCTVTDGNALGHSFTNYVSNNDATCLTDGTKTAKCDRCDETDTVTDVNTKLGHDFADATCTAPKTCKRDGCTVTDGNALGHSFANYVSDNNAACTVDGTKTAKCDRCEEKDTVTDVNTKLGHDFADATCTAPKTCKRDGCTVTEGDALGHTYDNACDANCNVCNEARTPSSHVWDGGAVTKEPTKEEEGVKTYTCTVCGETKTESIPKLTGCGGGGGAMIALLSNSAIALVWFVLKKKH